MFDKSATTLETPGPVQFSNTNRNLWMLVGGIGLGAVVASAVWGFLMWRQVRRHQAEIVALTGTGALVRQTGDAVSGLLGNALSVNATSNLSVDEVKDFLDNKTLPLPEEGKPDLNIANDETSSKSVVLKPEHIESMSLPDLISHVRNPDDPWQSHVVFLVALPEGRFVVHATVDHLPVGDKRAFYGWAVRRVVKQ